MAGVDRQVDADAVKEALHSWLQNDEARSKVCKNASHSMDTAEGPRECAQVLHPMHLHIDKHGKAARQMVVCMHGSMMSNMWCTG